VIQLPTKSLHEVVLATMTTATKTKMTIVVVETTIARVAVCLEGILVVEWEDKPLIAIDVGMTVPVLDRDCQQQLDVHV